MNHRRRTWLFVAGADRKAHEAAARSGADVLVQELEDFTPPELRPRARSLAATLYERWRNAGALAAVRVNPLETCGRENLAAVMAGRPDIVLLSKVASPEHVRALEEATGVRKSEGVRQRSRQGRRQTRRSADLRGG